MTVSAGHYERERERERLASIVWSITNNRASHSLQLGQHANELYLNWNLLPL